MMIFTNGCFDILHGGHVRLLEYARSLGDTLVVGINSDDSVRRLKGPLRPIMPLESRMAVLEAMWCVSEVHPFDEDTPTELIARLKPDVIVRGPESGGDGIITPNWPVKESTTKYLESKLLCDGNQVDLAGYSIRFTRDGGELTHDLYYIGRRVTDSWMIKLLHFQLADKRGMSA